MPDTRLILGNISFQEFEIPAKINFGGKQNLAIHKLVGGYRVVDTLGPDPDDIKWQGRFRGASALSRARALDRLRASGAQVPLMWGGLSYSVVLSHFKADYEKFYEIPYECTCTVVSDSVGGLTLIDIVGGLIGDVTGGVTSVSLGGLAGLANLPPATAYARLLGADAEELNRLGGLL